MPRVVFFRIGLTALLALAALIAPLPIARAAPVDRRIELDARMFAFTPERTRVHVGDRITLVLRSEDVMHGVYLDGYGVRLTAEPGKPAETTFVADRAGKFRYRCSVTCGALHPFMIGELVVGPNLPFWRATLALVIVVAGALVILRPLTPSPTP